MPREGYTLQWGSAGSTVGGTSGLSVESPGLGPLPDWRAVCGPELRLSGYLSWTVKGSKYPRALFFSYFPPKANVSFAYLFGNFVGKGLSVSLLIKLRLGFERDPRES